ncbi:MAG TPA: FCD domain-containing protein, partial [Chloroflexota bacterium]|nr:FCD domain-containing protein [Chloroflexota bacterium]
KANDVREIYAVREALELLAARTLAAAATDRLAATRTILDRMRSALSGAEHQRFFELDVEFHTALCAATGNRRLQDLFSGLRPDIQRIALFAVNAMPLEGPDAPESMLANHEALLSALTQGNAEAAQAALSEYFDGRSQRVAEMLGEK